MSKNPNVYFVLNGLLNGEEGEHALTAGGDGALQADGWYYLKPGDTDGTGPFPSRATAEAVENERRERYFYCDCDDGEWLEVDAGWHSPYGETVAICRPVSAGPRGLTNAWLVECACYYDESGYFALTTTGPLPRALACFAAAIKRDADFG